MHICTNTDPLTHTYIYMFVFSVYRIWQRTGDPLIKMTPFFSLPKLSQLVLKINLLLLYTVFSLYYFSFN